MNYAKNKTMKKAQLFAAITVVFCLQIAFTASAQDEKGTKYKDPEWKRISLTSFRNGQSSRAREIVRNYHQKASDRAGTPKPAMIIDLISGDYDVMTVWDMKEGLEEFNWETSPRDIKWRKAFDEIAGGADKGKAILDEYSSLIIRTQRYIGKIRK